MTSLGWQNFADMVTDVGRLVGDSSTGRRRPIKDAMMRYYDTIAAAWEWPQLVAFDESGVRDLGSPTIKSLEAGEPEAPAPFYTGKIRSMMLQGVQAPAIEVVQPGLLAELMGSQPTLSGRPRYASHVASTAQTQRLAADSSLTASCPDSNVNNNTLSVVVEYRRESAPVGHESTVIAAGAFTEGVALPGTAAAGYPISKVVLPSGWAGGLTIEDTGGTEIVSIRAMFVPLGTVINESQTIAKPLFRFWPVPDQDYGITWTWWRRPRRLVEDHDTPEIPVTSYLVSATAADILRSMDKLSAAREQERQADIFVRSLRRQNNVGPIHVLPRGGNFVSMTGADS